MNPVCCYQKQCFHLLSSLVFLAVNSEWLYVYLSRMAWITGGLLVILVHTCVIWSWLSPSELFCEEDYAPFKTDSRWQSLASNPVGGFYAVCTTTGCPRSEWILGTKRRIHTLSWNRREDLWVMRASETIDIHEFSLSLRWSQIPPSACHKQWTAQTTG